MILAGVGYQKLPNPISGILQRLPVVDGEYVGKLLVFLDIVLQLAEFPGLPEDVLLSVIYPYCRGSLAELVTDTLRRGGSIDSLHGEVLDSFISRRQRELLKCSRFYRAQANGEALVDFVQDIRKIARILRLGLPEKDIVQVILEGVTPQERSRLVFADRPRCFADLERLCVVSRTVQEIDESREQVAHGKVRPERHVGRIVPSSCGDEIEIINSCNERRRRSPNVTCFRCGRLGHVRRFCTGVGSSPTSLPKAPNVIQKGVNKGKICRRSSPACRGSSKAVSYTHLDVYKRQSCNCPIYTQEVAIKEVCTLKKVGYFYVKHCTSSQPGQSKLCTGCKINSIISSYCKGNVAGDSLLSITFMTVSYTHLDVYKRQIQGCMQKLFDSV